MYPCWKFRSDPFVPFRCPVECCCHSELVVGLNGTMGTFASRSDGRPCWLLHPVASSDMVGLHRTALESNCSHRCIPIFVRAVNSSASYIKNINGERLEGLKQQKKWWFLYLIRTEEDAQIVFEIISPYSLPPNPYHLPPHSSDAAECCDIFENSTGREFVCFYCELKFEVWFLASFGFFVLDLFIFFLVCFKGKCKKKEQLHEWMTEDMCVTFHLYPFWTPPIKKNDSFLLLALILAFQTTFCYASKTLRKNYIMESSDWYDLLPKKFERPSPYLNKLEMTQIRHVFRFTRYQPLSWSLLNRFPLLPANPVTLDFNTEVCVQVPLDPLIKWLILVFLPCRLLLLFTSHTLCRIILVNR